MKRTPARSLVAVLLTTGLVFAGFGSTGLGAGFGSGSAYHGGGATGCCRDIQ